MKKYLLLLFLLQMQPVFAQETDTVEQDRLAANDSSENTLVASFNFDNRDSVHSVRFNFAGVLFGKYELAYEYQLLPYLSLSFPLYLHYWGASAFRNGYLRNMVARMYSMADFSVGSGVGARFFSGVWYAEPMLKLSFAQFEHHGRIGTRNALEIKPGLGVGVRYNLGAGVFFDTGLRISALIYAPKNSVDRFPVIDLNTSIGYAW